MICPQCSTENASNAKHCFRCGGALQTDAITTPEISPLAQSPAPSAYDLTSPGTSSAPPIPGAADPPSVPYAPPGYYPGQAPLGGYPPQNGPPYPQAYPAPYAPEPNIIDSIVPTHNPKALTGYYMAVFSVIPLLGILLGIGGFVLGIMGLKEANRNPAIKGKAHAWVAIIVGGFFGFGYLALLVLGIVAVVLSRPGSQ